jgi:hypothetical protein
VQVNWIRADGISIGTNYYRIGDDGKFDLNVYQESTKTLNKDTVKVGQKVRVIADKMPDGYGNTAKLQAGYEGIVTGFEDECCFYPDHKWVLLDGRKTGYAVCSELLELLEEPKSKEVIPEYVECIKGFNTDLSVNDFNVVGKIYEVESYNPKTERLKLKGFEGSIAYITFDGNSESLATDYKISDKASFDTQQNPKETLVGRYLKALVNNPVSIGMDIGEYLLITKYNHQDNTYGVTRVRDNHTGFGIEVSDLPKFEVMPVGFNPKVKEPVNTEEDWCIKITSENQKLVRKYFKEKGYDSGHCYSIGAYYGELYKKGRSDSFDSFAKELTLNEFKRLVLKENATEEFKVGDWVTVIDTNIGKPHETMSFKSGVLTSKITEVSSSIDYRYRVNDIWCDVRRATPSEIFEAQKVERDEHAGQLLKDLHGVSGSDKHLEYPIVPEGAFIRTYDNFKKQKYQFSEVEYLLKPINQQLDLPIVKKYKKKSIINL